MKSRKWQKSGERGFFVLKWLNFEGNDWMKSRNFRKTALFVLAVFISGCGRRTEPPLTRQADLVVCTDLELPVYEPVVKEFEERTGLIVEVQAGTSEEIRTWFAQEQTERNGDGKPGPDQTAEWDLAFGVNTELLDEYKELWFPCESSEAKMLDSRYVSPDHVWTGFSVLPLVIMYNTNVVTYRELPVGWESLLEPRWQGRVAFADPEQSDVSVLALAAAMLGSQSGEAYIGKLAENLNYKVLKSVEQVNEGILDGRYSVGVTTEAAAQTLRSGGADVDYIYPEEGTAMVLDGTAVRAGSSHKEEALAFLDFTVSRDAQKIMAVSRNRRSVRTDTAAEKGMDPMEKLPFPEAGRADLSEAKQRADRLWQQADGREGGA